jgi:hypothetical protein
VGGFYFVQNLEKPYFKPLSGIMAVPHWSQNKPPTTSKITPKQLAEANPP